MHWNIHFKTENKNGRKQIVHHSHTILTTQISEASTPVHPHLSPSSTQLSRRPYHSSTRRSSPSGVCRARPVGEGVGREVDMTGEASKGLVREDCIQLPGQWFSTPDLMDKTVLPFFISGHGITDLGYIICHSRLLGGIILYCQIFCFCSLHNNFHLHIYILDE